MSYFKNSKGITLVEILATVVILSIVIFFVSSILQSTAKQNKEQQTAARELNDARFILKTITKDIRRSYDSTVGEDVVLFHSSSASFTYKIQEIDNIPSLVKIKKLATVPANLDAPDGYPEIVAKDISCFSITETEEGSYKFKIRISTNPDIENCNESNKEVKETILQIRKGDI